MTIDGASGSIQWTPSSGQVGSQAVTVRVQDVGGLFDTQSFSIDVAAVNHAPVITSTEVNAATEDTLYSYEVEASDSFLRLDKVATTNDRKSYSKDY
jgi:hypothetical protein